MGCQKCKPVFFERGDDLKVPGLHQWVKLAVHNYDEYCKLCHVRKRTLGINDPCIGRPLWQDVKKNGCTDCL